MKHAVGAHGATVSYAGRSFINGHGSHLLSMFTPSYSAFWALCAKRRAVQTARHRLSKKSACGDLFRQNAFSLRFQRGRGNAQGNLAAQGFRIHRTCRWIRISLGGLRPSEPLKRVFGRLSALCKQRAKLFPSVPLWRRHDPRSPPVCVSADSISLRSGRESARQAAIRPPTLSTIISTSVSSPVSASMYTRYSLSS